MCLPVESSWAVLDAILGGTMASYPDGVWVITGTGHHRSGHAAEGVLFNSVKVRVWSCCSFTESLSLQEYLDSGEYLYDEGVDAQGHRGAFYVRGSS